MAATKKKSTNHKRLLKDQLATQQQLNKIHDNHRELDEEAFYPPHDKRTESPEYAKVHKKLVEQLDLPCLICGVKNSTLSNRRHNTFGSKQMETHHHVIEWALANAIDVKLFNKTLRPSLAHRHPDNAMYQRNMTKKEVLAWVDHSEDNLWVLCDVHHRHKFFGIHAITFPIWGPQNLLAKNFEDYVKKELLALTKTKAKTKK
jgi:hypothetical protein